MQSAKVKKYSDEYLILVWRDDQKRGAQKMGMKMEHTGGNFVFKPPESLVCCRAFIVVDPSLPQCSIFMFFEMSENLWYFLRFQGV